MPKATAKKPTAAKVKYRRILLKLSGEVLHAKDGPDCIDPDVLARMADQIKAVRALGVQVGVVIGGGNIFRGLRGLGLSRPSFDGGCELLREFRPSRLCSSRTVS